VVQALDGIVVLVAVAPTRITFTDGDVAGRKFVSPEYAATSE
jgi:hypothetical protein